MSFIGLDIGTSFIKGAVLDVDKFLLSYVSRVPFPQRLDLGNALLVEFDPNVVTETTRHVIQRLLLHMPNCEGIVVCCQMHGMVLVNERGERHSNFISWTDHRGNMRHASYSGSYIDEIYARISSRIRRRLGNELNLERPACFLFWLAEQGLLDPGLIPLSIADYVLGALCEPALATDITNASATGLLNLQQSTWDDAVIDALGLETLRFPNIRPHGEIIGYFRNHTYQIPCYLPMGDFQCALMGAMVDSSDLSINVSTGAQVSRITNDLQLGEYQTRPFFDRKLVNTYSDAPGGLSFNLLSNLLFECASHDELGGSIETNWSFIAQTLDRVKDTDLKVDPWVNRHSGSIHNMRVENMTAGHVLRGALKGMVRVYEQHANRLWPERTWSDIVLSGGFALKSEALRDMVRQQFKSNCRLPPFSEDTLFGLLILARVFGKRAHTVIEIVEHLRESL
ncbi:MAG: FGGY family carbohydrate kinase [Acidobacteriaceae bacterium]